MSIEVTWLGHSTVVLDLDGVRIVADPLLQRHAGILRRRGQTPERAAWHGADAILLSHLHHDHAELAQSGSSVISGDHGTGERRLGDPEGVRGRRSR